jgi:hypothetical protein
MHTIGCLGESMFHARLPLGVGEIPWTPAFAAVAPAAWFMARGIFSLPPAPPNPIKWGLFTTLWELVPMRGPSAVPVRGRQAG